jgi:hypothetical protein
MKQRDEVSTWRKGKLILSTRYDRNMPQVDLNRADTYPAHMLSRNDQLLSKAEKGLSAVYTDTQLCHTMKINLGHLLASRSSSRVFGLRLPVHSTRTIQG